MKSNIRIVGVIGSPKPQGNTAVLVHEALKGAEEKGAITKEIFLLDHKMAFCKGCLRCLKEGKCFMSDDFALIKKELVEADGIVWGSPVYGKAPTAIMKLLIDRLGMLEVASSALGGKYMLGVSTANSASAAKKLAGQLAHFGNGGTFMRSYTSGCLGVGTSGGRVTSQNAEALKKARSLGTKLVHDIETEKKYRLQNPLERILTSVIMKPAFSKYIMENKNGDAKELYASLRLRGLLT